MTDVSQTPLAVNRVNSEGSSRPLGVTWIPEADAWNFALYSKHATRVVLLIYCEEELAEPLLRVELDYLTNKSGPIWHGRVSRKEFPAAQYYAYQVHGSEVTPGFEIHAFDSEKVLLDPYAEVIYFPPEFDRQAAMLPGSNQGRAALGLLQSYECAFDWCEDRPVLHDSDLVIYELHVGGFTRHASSGVEVSRRGTFLGLLDKIPYLKELGVTAVELMPVFQFDPQNGDYWGYMPLSFFAPHHGYTSDSAVCNQQNEFRELVKQLHVAGIEVILDVVYNHTCEGDQHGPTYSYKGIDNSTYYLLSGDSANPYLNYSGTGNTLHTANRAVRQLIVDSLRYWVKEMHVDGFRFDLASVFVRNEQGEVTPADPPIFGQIAAEPELATIRLIAEPWDAGGGYELGSRFPGLLWMQWNSRFRDTVQRVVRGDRGLVPELMTRLYGSSDLFPDDLLNACRPWQSINYVDSHDGSTLYDLTAYNEKHNWANGNNNTDGANEFRWNCGFEGEIDSENDGENDANSAVLQLRKQQVKNYFCLLMLSNGTPMFRMGDEFLATQRGNNNPYNQDNETTWLDWQRLEQHRDVFRFFQKMIAFRKAHPSIGRPHFWRDDVSWYGPAGPVDMGENSQTLAYCLRGGDYERSDLYVMINASDKSQSFRICEGEPDSWRLAVDTSSPSPEDILEKGDERAFAGSSVPVRGRSVTILRRDS